MIRSSAPDKNGVTQGWIAARTGLAQSTLSDYKRGKHQAEWASTLKKLADGLDMPLPLRQALGLSGGASQNSARPAGGMAAGIRPTRSTCNYSRRPSEGTDRL